jgi:hypothetical protein
MGYGYIFYLSLRAVPLSWKGFSEEELAQRLSSFIDVLYKVYGNLKKKHEWFPNFGESDSTSAGGYGTGPNEHLLPELFRLTSSFPDFTFDVYFFHWDKSHLTTYSIRGEKVLEQSFFDFEEMKLPGGFQLGLDIDGAFIKNDLSEALRTGDVDDINLDELKYNDPIEAAGSTPSSPSVPFISTAAVRPAGLLDRVVWYSSPPAATAVLHESQRFPRPLYMNPSFTATQITQPTGVLSPPSGNYGK